MNFNVENLIRENIKGLSHYSSARNEFTGSAEIYLDANENSFGSPISKNYHRYPDPLQIEIKKRLAVINGVRTDEIFVGNGSDEAIDLLYRIFCDPKVDNVLICPPTYGMYQVSAAINDIAVKEANLTEDFDLNPAAIVDAADLNTKLLFICSPNNPTGNSLDQNKIIEIAGAFSGIIVIDEAYIDFSRQRSFVSEIKKLENLVVLKTFSKAWGLAGLRVGMAFANSKIIGLFNKVKPPYNVSEIAQNAVIEALENREMVNRTILKIISEREKLIGALSEFEFVTKIYPTDANFVLVKTDNADLIYEHLVGKKIIVRNRNRVEKCEGCLRITVGTPEENQELVNSLREYSQD
ncbi:MAG: histidinol-phosphate transaminase [Acidobacteria bacterium]|nr:histidinol-phosphate transaminase [Acidobacteriota bacterium]